MSDTMQEPKTLEEVLKLYRNGLYENEKAFADANCKHDIEDYYLWRDAMDLEVMEDIQQLIKQARADQLKKLWNATQHDIVPEGTPPRDMSEELHKMIKELEA